MKISSARQGSIMVVNVEGAIDGASTGAFEAELSGQIKAGNTRLVLELSKVDYIASAGLRSILATLKGCRQAGGDLRLAALAKDVGKVIEMAGMNTLIKVDASLEDSLKAFS